MHAQYGQIVPRQKTFLQFAKPFSVIWTEPLEKEDEYSHEVKDAVHPGTKRRPGTLVPGLLL